MVKWRSIFATVYSLNSCVHVTALQSFYVIPLIAYVYGVMKPEVKKKQKNKQTLKLIIFNLHGRIFSSNWTLDELPSLHWLYIYSPILQGLQRMGIPGSKILYFLYFSGDWMMFKCHLNRDECKTIYTPSSATSTCIISPFYCHNEDPSLSC